MAQAARGPTQNSTHETLILMQIIKRHLCLKCYFKKSGCLQCLKMTAKRKSCALWGGLPSIIIRIHGVWMEMGKCLWFPPLIWHPEYDHCKSQRLHKNRWQIQNGDMWGHLPGNWKNQGRNY